MRQNFLIEILLAVVLIGLLIILINPFEIFMPSALLMMLAIVLALIFAIFAIFVWKEKPADEREAFHGMHAGRVAFLVGSGFIVLGIIVQTFSHQVDAWLVAALGVMVLTKLAGLIYTRMKY
jgi:uncharacterized membrane protein YobD (UPF0266 family)